MNNRKTEKRKGRIKNSFSSRRFKSGVYSSFLTVFVIVMIVIVNLVFYKLDLSVDLSSGQMFTLSAETKEILKKVDEKVSIYYMVQDGSEEEYIDRVLRRYGKENDKVKVIKKDPIVYPEFAAKYVDDTISNNDVIVVNETTGAARYVSGEEMYYSTADYSSYSYEYFLDVEGQITSALSYVQSGETSKMYVLGGHGETALGETLTSSVDKMNIEIEELKLATERVIPKDCDILLINGPESDLLDGEKDAVLEYLKKGGDAIILNQFFGKKVKLPNLDEILGEYGIHVTQGMICEDRGNYYQYVNWIVPSVSDSSEITASLEKYIIMPGAEGLSYDKEDDLRSSLTISQLLFTSDNSFLKTDTSDGTAEKKDGDKDGPFSVGLYAQDDQGDNNITKLGVFANAEFISESYTASATLDNAAVIENTIKSMIDSTVETSIEAKSLSYSYISVPGGSSVLWAAVLIILIPAGFLVAGFIIWMVRRRK